MSLISTLVTASADVGVTSDAATAMGSTISSLFTSTSDATSDNEARRRSGRLSDAVNALSAALWVGVSEGEETLTVSTDNLKIATQVRHKLWFKMLGDVLT